MKVSTSGSSRESIKVSILNYCIDASLDTLIDMSAACEVNTYQHQL